MELRAHKFLVTGGGSGIGRAIAERLLADGASVVIAGRTESKLKQAASELGGDVYTLTLDISDCELIPSKLLTAERLLGGLDGFVNAAALGCDQALGRGYEPFDITPDEWDTLNDINYKGAFFAMRDEIEFLLSRRCPGNILNIASNAAYMGVTGSYGAAKTAIVRWTRAFGSRYGKYGIMINGIAPGATLTDMTKGYAKDTSQPYPRHALGRFIRPEEIALLAEYLLSTAGEIVCGHTVVADAGDSQAVL
ncbi:MAG TPA: SDR family oxidoreductase [Firmicutes bacterium]|nr:SDR family oxidoreductase [Bacillota bacterium]